MVEIKNVSESQVSLLAQDIASQLSAPMTLCLWGDLGAGKTTFCRALLRELNKDIKEVPSPTFTIIQEYSSSKGDIWHCDLYRLEHPEDVEELGLVDAFYEKICLIEWPERLGHFLPQNRLDIRITIAADLTRTIEITCHGATKIDLSRS